MVWPHEPMVLKRGNLTSAWRRRTFAHFVIASAAKQSRDLRAALWIASLRSQ
jgi:hypothetical protein